MSEDKPIGAILADMVSDPAKPATRSEPTTEDVLREMLTENTGRHILDSGGAYGRAWERNQGKDFDAQPEAEAEWRIYPPANAMYDTRGKEDELELMVTLDLFHFLSERLTYEPYIDAQFHMFADPRTDAGWLELMEEWASSDERGGGGHAFSTPVTENSYNHECLLSQTIQFTIFGIEDDDDTYVLLQIHGGCDVRGGYTEPRVFSMYDYELMDYAHCDVMCDGSGEPNINPEQLQVESGERVGEQPCNARWYSDDGSHFYDDERQNRLEDYPAKRGTEGEVGTVVVNEDANEAFCPVCGRGKLKVYPPIASG